MGWEFLTLYSYAAPATQIRPVATDSLLCRQRVAHVSFSHSTMHLVPIFIKCPAVIAAGLVAGWLAVVTAWLFWFYRKLRQSVITNIVVTASQQMYNSAWLGDNFVLDYR